MASKLRRERIAERIREDLSEILLQEVSDPRLVGVFISDVTVDKEVAFADVYYSALEGSSRSEEILDGLVHAQGYLRRSLAQRIELRAFPRPTVHWDPTAERAARIEDIIASLHTNNEIEAQDSPGENEGDDAV